MRRVVLAVASLLWSCSSHSPTERPPDEKAALGGQVAARVGGEPLPLSLVEAVAKSQKIPVNEAVRHVVDDEIAAAAARAKGLDQKRPTAWDLVAVRARITADRLRNDARSRGPATDDELERLSEAHWYEVNRPKMYNVVHTIALRPKDPKADTAPARALAEKLHAAVASAISVREFMERANAVPHDKTVNSETEVLPPFSEDGRTQSGEMDPTFAAAAAAMPVGTQSGIVESPFGWHIIRLVSVMPAQIMPMEDRRRAFADEVVAMRGHDAVAALMKDLTAHTKVAVSPNAESLMQSVPLATEQASNP